MIAMSYLYFYTASRKGGGREGGGKKHELGESLNVANEVLIH